MHPGTVVDPDGVLIALDGFSPPAQPTERIPDEQVHGSTRRIQPSGLLEVIERRGPVSTLLLGKPLRDVRFDELSGRGRFHSNVSLRRILEHLAAVRGRSFVASAGVQIPSMTAHGGPSFAQIILPRCHP